ncbi:MAG: hypothetical protein M1370_12255 [Bacteroidetes bacterium]|nr:hypothetical protein [Bacteroidota bacterium]
MQDLIGLAGVPLIIALVEGVKRVFPGLEPRWYPLVALACGEALNLALGLSQGQDWRAALVLGLVAGLAASGLYSGGKALAAGRSAERA